jgi:hypothetical protein
MADPTAWMLEEETESDRLRAALTEARSDLRWRDAALLKVQSELMASRLEVAAAREETMQFHGMLRRVEEAAARLEATGDRNAEITELHAVIASLRAETSALRVSMDLVHASASWRISAPVRVVGRLMRGIRTAGSRLLRAIRRARGHQKAPVSPPPDVLRSSGDPNDCAIFRAAPFVGHPSGEAEGVVTLDALYHLSRSL